MVNDRFSMFFFYRGLEPKLLSFSMALGITFGLFPIWGKPIFFKSVFLSFISIISFKVSLYSLIKEWYFISSFERVDVEYKG